MNEKKYGIITFIFKNRLIYKRFFILIVYLSNMVANYNLIPIITDQVEQSNFYINVCTPAFFPDLEYGAIKIDGTLNLPHNIYKIENYFNYDIIDTTTSNNYFIWKQGDYLYRDISIGIRSRIIEQGKFELLSHSRSFPGKNALLGPNQNNYKGNVLQNYLLKYDKKTENHFVETGFLYHKEKVGLPISNDYKYRLSESFHAGLKYSKIISYFNIETSFAIQIGRDIRSNNLNHNLVYWLDNVIIYTYQIPQPMPQFQISRCRFHYKC